MIEGQVQQVREVTEGTELTVDESAGTSNLDVESTVDFGEAGKLEIGGEIHPYVFNASNDQLLTIVGTLANAHSAGTPVRPYPAATEREVRVLAEGQQDSVEAIVPHALYDKLPLGVRTPGEDDERVQCSTNSGGEFQVDNVVGTPPLADPEFIDVGRVIELTDATATATSGLSTPVDFATAEQEADEFERGSGLIVPTRAGLYSVTATVVWEANNSGRRETAIRFGSELLAFTSNGSPPSIPLIQQVSAVVYVEAPKDIEIIVFQNSGSTLAVLADTSTGGIAASYPTSSTLKVARIV